MSRKEEFTGYTERHCEQCGSVEGWKVPFDGLVTRRRYAVCTKCGHRQRMKPGDILNNPEFLEPDARP